VEGCAVKTGRIIVLIDPCQKPFAIPAVVGGLLAVGQAFENACDNSRRLRRRYGAG